MTFVQRAVEALTDQQRMQLIADHQKWEKEGTVGDCLLREIARQVADGFGGFAGNGVLWMEHVATAAYRHFALRFIANMDDGK